MFLEKSNLKNKPVYENNRFHNYQSEKRHSIIIPSIFMLIKSLIFRNFVSNTDLINSWLIDLPKNKILERSQDLRITWIGHSTFLIQINNINIITDPVFGDLSVLFRRILPPGISYNNLPQIDYVLISHNHRDHLDLNSVRLLNSHKNIKFLVPLGVKTWFEKRDIYSVFEYNWWEQNSFRISGSVQNLFNSINFTFLPALHWSARGLFDYNKSLWGSWMIESQNTKIYFAGDTAYSDHFKNISCEFKDIDLALMPIGPCEPNKYMKHSHINAQEAVQCFIDLKARYFIPMHWGTYYFGTDKFEDPINRLLSSWKLQKFENSQELKIFKFGQSSEFANNNFITTPELELENINF